MESLELHAFVPRGHVPSREKHYINCESSFKASSHLPALTNQSLEQVVATGGQCTGRYPKGFLLLVFCVL